MRFQDLEELMCKKMIEVIACRSEIGEIRKKCDQQEEQVKIWKRKAQGYKKMNLDLNTVLRRYILDVQQNKTDAKPIKITRSVGLQVLDTSRRRVAQTPRPVFLKSDSSGSHRTQAQVKATAYTAT